MAVSQEQLRAKNMIEEGGAAFPSGDSNGLNPFNSGLTKREWFAGQALAGILANPALVKGWGEAGDDVEFEAVEMAFMIADHCL